MKIHEAGQKLQLDLNKCFPPGHFSVGVDDVKNIIYIYEHTDDYDSNQIIPRWLQAEGFKVVRKYIGRLRPLQQKGMTDEKYLEYINGLYVGERVVETTKSGMYGRCGEVYRSDRDGGLCVRWDALPGEGGRMGTSITWGTRRVHDVVNKKRKKNA